MQWPQITWIVLAAMSFTIHALKHGQPREAPHSMWMSLTDIAIMVFLLSSGGFFNPAHAQIPREANAYRLELVRSAHHQWGLDAPVAALAAQVHQESSWNPRAVSGVGAAGLAQFMPATASWWCDLNQLTPEQCQPQNPAWSMRALVGYDKWLFDRTPARYSAYDRLWVALRGYNGGLGHWQAESKVAANGSREAVDAACGRAKRAPVYCPENLGYPQRILVQLQPRYAAWGLSV